MISFFARVTYFEENSKRGDGLYLHRVSSRIRAEEIANYLGIGVRVNPKDGYENDVCVWIKPKTLKPVKDGDYVDVLDELVFSISWFKERPRVKIIAMTLYQYEYLKKNLKNEIILIPHHHINFERIQRKKNDVLTCGYIGAYSKNHLEIDKKIKKKLNEIGVDFVPLLDFKWREDAIEYYKKIDIQIIPYHDCRRSDVSIHPTKIINAASFGIPTIAIPFYGYKEVEGFYIPLKNIDNLVEEVKRLKENYVEWSNKVIRKSEEYHISNISELYKNLWKKQSEPLSMNLV